MKYIGLGLYVALTLVLPLALGLSYMADDPTMASYFIMTSIIGWAFSTVFLIPPVLLVNTLLGAKIKLNTKKDIAPEYKDFSDEERNALSYSILEQMYQKLPSAQMEDGSDGFKIETGKDAVRLKRTIEYIASKIQPNNEEINDLLENNASFYQGEMKRLFLGAKAVIVVMIVALVLILLAQNHPQEVLPLLLGGGLYIGFYYYSAKRPVYLLKKDEEQGKEFDSSLLSQTIKSIWGPDKYEVRHYRGGERNYGREVEDSVMNFVMKLIATVIASIIALFLSPIYAFYYFCSNYWGNCLNPFKNIEKWMKNEYDFAFSMETSEEVPVEAN